MKMMLQLTLAVALLPIVPAMAEPPGTQQLIGTFVGLAADEVHEGGPLEQRDIVMELRPYRETGLQLEWHNVTLVNGRRDVPGVKFRHDEVLLAPAPERSFFLAQVGYDPFAEKRSLDAVAGDPLRWGVAEGDQLSLFSLAIHDDGTYELQVTERRPDGNGVSLEFDRILDGQVVRRMTGRAVRAQ